MPMHRYEEIVASSSSNKASWINSVSAGGKVWDEPEGGPGARASMVSQIFTQHAFQVLVLIVVILEIFFLGLGLTVAEYSTRNRNKTF